MDPHYKNRSVWQRHVYTERSFDRQTDRMADRDGRTGGDRERQRENSYIL